jgi:hypothetical protein
MSNIHAFDENIRDDVAMDIATLNNTPNVPVYFSMANYDLAVFLVFTGTLAANAVVTLQMRQRIGAAGTEANVGTAGALADTDDDAITILQVRGEELNVDGGYDRVGILLTETATQNAEVGVICLRMRPRYAQNTLPA